LCLPAAAGLIVLAKPFVILLTAPDYYEGYKIVGYVVLSSFIWGLSNIAMMGLTIKRRSRRLAANTVLAASFHIGLQLILVPTFGYFASAVSTLAGYTILLGLHTLTSRKLLTWHFPLKTLRNVLIASIILGLIAWGTYSLAGSDDKVSFLFLVLSIAAAGLTYLACLWGLGEIKPGEKERIVQYWPGSKNKKHV
jgi:O-antigen/teichoic acid export membrane protein